MLFKRTAFFFLTLASATLLLHNIVPHSHEHSAAGNHSHRHGSGDTHHHHDNIPADDHQEDENDLTDILSVINHQSEGITFLTHNASNAIAKKLSSFAFSIPEIFYINNFNLPPLLYHSPAHFFECISFDPCTNALRGPPSVAV